MVYHFILLSVLLFLQREVGAISRCNRIPDEILRPRNPDGAKYIIEISDDPSSYVAGSVYTVNLRGNPLIGGKHMFKEFMLSVEPKNMENQLELDHTKVGYFMLVDRQLSKFSSICENTITQTNSVSKDSIQVYWVAPPTGSGCVAFRATVVESKESWFSEEGFLTKVLCEEVSENEDVQPDILEECSACDEAKYELVFEGLWTRNTHPKDYPSNVWYTKFGDVIGASHGNGESFWKYDELASQNMKILGENGDTRGLEKELKENMGKTVRTIIKANGLRYPNITGKTFAFFRVDAKNHLVSIVSKIIPSPDWILGVSNFELCHEDGTWSEQRVLNLYPWDVGTDDGSTYNSPKIPNSEPKVIQKIATDTPDTPFFDTEGKEMKPFAKLYLTRLKTYKKECPEGQGVTGDPSETTTEQICPTTKWSEWSPCSVTCGKGTSFMLREFLNTEDEDECKDIKDLRRVQSCNLGKCFLPSNDPRCELTEWSDWSSCTADCGKGTKTHDKKFKSPEFAEQCENNDPSHLQEDEECDGEEKNCDGHVEEDPICKDKYVWGPFSVCNVTCGEGFKTRLRSLKNAEDEETEDMGCKNMEVVSCKESPCKEDAENNGQNVGGMDIFNQVTTEIYSQPYGPVANCKVSDWSIWGPCEPQSGTCGKGYIFQHRQILQHQMNGGKGCPKKLMRKRRCHVPCHPEKTEHIYTTSSSIVEATISEADSTKSANEPVDCVMSDWSQWSPCSFNCGDSAVQQRTRSIRVHPKNNGKPCESRLDERACPLPLACSDKGVPIM